MRANIFLHFLNRDTREIHRVYDLLEQADHASALRAPLNAAAMLCEDACYAPPGFVIEDEIAFELFEAQSAYLESGLLQLPLRERSLADYAEKKRTEYAPARNRYSGLYDDSRMAYLSTFGSALTKRQVQIGPAIANGFLTGVDTRKAAWKHIRETAPLEIIQSLRSTPKVLAEEGQALTWSIMQPRLIHQGGAFQKDIRDALQYVYFQEYCREFKLLALVDIPYIMESFYLPAQRRVYNFRRLRAFLDCFHASSLLLNASADFINSLRRSAGFTELMDAYVGLAAASDSVSDLRYKTSRLVTSAKYSWEALSIRHAGAINDPTSLEALEITDACSELAGLLTNAYGLPSRIAGVLPQRCQVGQSSERKSPLKVAIFVALEEEYNVLAQVLALSRDSATQVATGMLGSVTIAVLCPRKMGRVAAAVTVSRYLSMEKVAVVLCVGLAGGFEEAEIDPGAVICANTVVDLANRKVVDDDGGNADSRFRREDFPCTDVVYSIARSESFDIEAWEAYCRKNFEWPPGRLPSLREGMIASVDEVIASDDHRKKLVACADKLLGVEMEAGGVCAAAKAFNVPVAVLRVVSDKADPSKADDRWRLLGMKTLAELIKRLPMEEVIRLSSGE